jgi:folate-dependent phosphoribosylglycinamide formyltransferase PurN
VPVQRGDTQDSLAARVLEVEHRLLPLVVTALARAGLPTRPLRLFSHGSTFVTGDRVEVAFGA